jgi:predicted ATPase
MLKEIDLKFGNNQTIKIPIEGITIFIGPNHSGKSLILREIEQVISVQSDMEKFKILSDFDIEWPEEDQFLEDLRRLETKRDLNLPVGHANIGNVHALKGREEANILIEGLKSQRNAKSNKMAFCNSFFKFFLIRLDGKTRFSLTDDKPRGDLLTPPPSNMLQKLFIDDNARKLVRKLIFDAFGYYFVIDALSANLRIRLSEKEPDSTTEEQSLDIIARSFHGEALYIKEASDGIQAYTGIISSICSGEYKTILIDEPEAFLHPPLARKLGVQLSQLASKYSGNLIAATHSADFVMGCIQSEFPVNIVRLEYKRGVSKVIRIDSNELKSLVEHPLMKSSNVLSSLTYDGVIVTESDNDRIFYHEIYDRICKKNTNMPSILFLNAQNKQTIVEILQPLRKFGVPAAAIVDIDILKDGGKTWLDWLNAANIPDGSKNGYATQRAEILKKFLDPSKMKEGGIGLLPPGDKNAATEL